jgi:hypothetical protein
LRAVVEFGTESCEEAPMILRSLLSALGVACVCFTAPAYAEESESGDVDPEALALLRAMAEQIASAERLSVSVEVAYEVLQEDGEILEFGGRRSVTLRRPDGLRVENESRDGQRGGIVFDGKRVVFFDTDENVYAAVDRPGDVDAAIDFVQARLDTPVPLGELLDRDVVATIVDTVETGEVVGVDTIAGVSCHHLAFRNDAVDFQVWIQREGQPLLHRVVIVHREEEGAPRFSASLGSWSFSPSIPDGAFVFEPGPADERIPVVVPKALVAAGEEQE